LSYKCDLQAVSLLMLKCFNSISWKKIEFVISIFTWHALYNTWEMLTSRGCESSGAWASLVHL